MSLLAEHQQTQGSHSDHQDDDIDEEDQILGGMCVKVNDEASSV